MLSAKIDEIEIEMKIGGWEGQSVRRRRRVLAWPLIAQRPSDSVIRTTPVQ